MNKQRPMNKGEKLRDFIETRGGCGNLEDLMKIAGCSSSMVAQTAAWQIGQGNWQLNPETGMYSRGPNYTASTPRFLQSSVLAKVMEDA